MADFPNALYEPVFTVTCVVPGCGWTTKALNPDLLLPEWERHRVLHNDGFKPCGCRVDTTDRDCPDCNDGEVER